MAPAQPEPDFVRLLLRQVRGGGLRPAAVVPGYRGGVRRLSLLLVAAALAGGCAGSDRPSRAEYQAVVVATRDDVDGALAYITQAESLDDLLGRMEQASETVDQAGDELAEADVAKGFDDENQELADAFRGLAIDLDGTAEQMREPGFDELLTGAQGLSFENWTKANRVLARMREQGVKVPPLERH